MMLTEERSQDKVPFWLIGIISLVVPVLVAFLFFFDGKLSLGEFVYQLPHFHGVLNSLTAVVLILGLAFVKNGNVDWHRRSMTSAVCMGGIFLVSYVTYHGSVDSVMYGDLNHDRSLSDPEKVLVPYRWLYLIVLFSHIFISVFTLPFVLIAFVYALRKNFEKHKKFVRWAYPMWLYVSVTGVAVYLMMRPYY